MTIKVGDLVRVIKAHSYNTHLVGKYAIVLEIPKTAWYVVIYNLSADTEETIWAGYLEVV